MKIILIEKRRPFIFLFLSETPMTAKTETALFLGGTSHVPIVHGDEYLRAIRNRNIGDLNLQQNINALRDDGPLDRSVFAQFLDQIPVLEQNEDIVFDFLMPTGMHFDVAAHFEEKGYYPILCMTPGERKKLLAIQEQNEQKELRLRQSAERAVRTIADSTSWKLTAPVRYFGRRFPKLAGIARRVFRTRMPGSSD